VLEDGPTHTEETRRSAADKRHFLGMKQPDGRVEMASWLEIDMRRVPALLRDRGNARSP
jgi:hypothetical protein